MHQLKALLWRSYKVRTRQYYTSALDLLGPVFIILLYVATKFLLNQTHAPQVDESVAKLNYFSHNGATFAAGEGNRVAATSNSTANGTTTATDRIDLKRDIRRHMCTKILYFPGTFDSQSSSTISAHLTNECGFQLVEVSSRGELVRGLQGSLARRVAYQRAGTDLNKINSTSDNCIMLFAATEKAAAAATAVVTKRQANSDSSTIYQIGLARTGPRLVEIHMTDSAGSSVIFMPYSQGSTYNEYKFPQSDLNLGTHLIEICLAEAFKRIGLPPGRPEGPTTSTATTTTMRMTSASADHRQAAPTSAPRAYASQILRAKSGEKTGEGSLLLANGTLKATQSEASRLTSSIKWRYKPFPVQTGVFVLPISTAIAILLAYLCTNTVTVMRVTDEIEFGLHQYARLAGLPAGYYWLSTLIMSAGQLFVQALVVAILLGIPTGDYAYDPFSEATMTTRWMLLFTYSLAANAHAVFIASLFDRSSNGLMVACLIASTYAEYSLLLILQWTPYRYDSLTAITWFTLLNPASVFIALCCVLISVTMQTNENFGWSHLSERIVGGGFSEYSVAELWLLMIIHILVNIALTIVIDQYKYSTTTNFFGFVRALVNELCFCNYCGSRGGHGPADELARGVSNSTQSRRNPHRICCSLRQIDVCGATTMMPYTRGNPLKLSRHQMRAIRAQVDERTVSKTTQLLVNTRSPTSPRDTGAGVSSGSQKEQPIVLDDVIKQNIIWYKTEIKFENLNLDFRFNQISFVLGQTDLKELLFAALLGVSPLDAGHVIIDGTSYSASTMSLARQQIGYLSDKDIFYNDLTIFENLQFYGSIRETSYKSYDSESLYVLSLLHLSSRRNNFPASLTHRSARKLALGVASVGYTKLLLLTEPTLNLRWRPRCQVHNLLRKYKSIRSIVVDSSDVDEAVAFGDRIVLLKNGSADLSDTPARLARQLACGYWLVFEPTTGDGRTVNSEALKALEKLTNEMFKQDKLDLDASKASIYQDLTRASAASGTSPDARISRASGGSGAGKITVESGNTMANITSSGATARRPMVIVKVQHSLQSSRALCNLLKMFAHRNIYNFKLAQVSYESLEDIIVLRMSRALYPDLPPDLLLSLQHRTQLTQKSPEPSPISVRKLSSSARTSHLPAPSGTIFAAGLATIVRDRLRNRAEVLSTLMALIVSLMVVLLTLHSLRSTLSQGGNLAGSVGGAGNSSGKASRSSFMAQAARDHRIVKLSSIEQLYKYRIGFYVIDRSSRTRAAAGSTSGLMRNSTTTKGGGGNLTHDGAGLLQAWHGNKDLAGVIRLRDELRNLTDAELVAKLVDRSRDLAGALIAFDPLTSEATVIFEPHAPHVLLASIKTFLDFSYSLSPEGQAAMVSAAIRGHKSSLARLSEHDSAPAAKGRRNSARSDENDYDYVSPVYTSRVNFRHTWHEMVHGYPLRRLIYGFGLAIAEAIFMSALVMAPMRHRTESKLARVQTRYWLSMGLFDLVLSLVHIACYLVLFALVEGVRDGRLLGAMLIALFLYKLASLPIAYLTSLAAESTLRAALFILLLYFTVAWDMAIFLRAFVEWTLYSDSYLYTMANWILFGMPITGLVESLIVINQVSTIRNRCPEIPAYTATQNTVDLEGIRRDTVVDTLLEKVRECLANGKTFVSTDVLHRQGLGIMWSIYLILLFGLIIWAFLLTSERLFGIVARRLSSNRTSNDPMKTVVRLADHTTSLFVWDKERDRLISEYIRCMNEFKYVTLMAHNCLILRVWLKPMSDQESPDHHLSAILEPLLSLGHSKNDIQVELRTTLQIFVRIGDETKHCRVDKIQLIETYSRYVASHGDVVAKFAIVDWTRENLYKILLHGHYNNKTSTTPGVT